jgi:exopolysaccharide biosynthesis polyprenyl glycosylphosphotransferase
MLTYRRHIRATVELAFDVIAVAAAWQLAAALAKSPRTPPLAEPLLLWIVAAAFFRVYRRSRLSAGSSYIHETLRPALFVGLAIFIPLLYSHRWDSTWLFLCAFMVALLVNLPVGKLMCRSVVEFLGSRWPARSNVALVGGQDRAAGIAWRLRQAKATDVRGLILSRTPSGEAEPGAMAVLGTTRNLAEVINREQLDTLVLVDTDISELEIQACSEVSARMGVRMTWSLSTVPVAEEVSYWDDCGIPLLELEPHPFSRKQRVIKRAVDILGSAALLIILAPLMLTIAGLVALTSRGPVLYAARRVGRGGRYFKFLKFRSMYVNTGRADVAARNEKSGHLFKLRDDPRVTPLGRFLRRYSLDELPQFLNVLMGDMSLVGPRPLPIEDLGPDGMSRTFEIWSEHRASVPPGITGLWQIRGRSELPFADLVRHDLEYIHNWSLRLDITILLKTPFEIFCGRGAY